MSFSKNCEIKNVLKWSVHEYNSRLNSLLDSHSHYERHSINVCQHLLCLSMIVCKTYSQFEKAFQASHFISDSIGNSCQKASHLNSRIIFNGSHVMSDWVQWSSGLRRTCCKLWWSTHLSAAGHTACSPIIKAANVKVCTLVKFFFFFFFVFIIWYILIQRRALPDGCLLAREQNLFRFE